MLSNLAAFLIYPCSGHAPGYKSIYYNQYICIYNIFIYLFIYLERVSNAQ